MLAHPGFFSLKLMKSGLSLRDGPICFRSQNQNYESLRAIRFFVVLKLTKAMLLTLSSNKKPLSFRFGVLIYQ
jgi:hypothetical protein